jgi:hypothetical protein
MTRWTILWGLIIFSLYSMTPYKDNLLIGTWKAVDIRDETGASCSKPEAAKFTLEIFSDGKFESFIQKNQDNWHYWGKCRIDTLKALPWLLFTNVKRRGNTDSLAIYDVADEKHPLLSLKTNSLIIRYNFCCLKDTCDQTSGWVTFKKDK